MLSRISAIIAGGSTRMSLSDTPASRPCLPLCWLSGAGEPDTGYSGPDRGALVVDRHAAVQRLQHLAQTHARVLKVAVCQHDVGNGLDLDHIAFQRQHGGG